jgi:hypothetical protein
LAHSILHAVQQGFKLALAVSQGREVVFHLARRFVERGGDLPNFVPRTFGNPRGEFSAGDFVGELHNPLQAARRELCQDSGEGQSYQKCECRTNQQPIPKLHCAGSEIR